MIAPKDPGKVWVANGFFVVAFFLCVAIFSGVLYRVYQSGARDPDPVVAVEPLPRNHRVGPGDLETGAIRDMQGRFLTETVAKGGTVTSANLAEAPVGPATENTVAAIIRMARVDSHRISSGDRVLLCSGGSPLTTRVKVIFVDCGADALWCSVTVELPTVPDALRGPGAAAAATLTTGADCSGQWATP